MFSSVASSESPAATVQNNRYIVFGLGNIGPSYVNTRHNIGRDLITKISSHLKSPLDHNKHICDFSADIPLEDSKLITLAVPDTYMNLSGKSVRKLADSLGVPAENVIVVHDDLDLALGHVRIRNRGSAGGQNGIKDIHRHMGNDSPFSRVRIGIGRPASPRTDISDFVLGKFTSTERAELDFVTRQLWEAVRWIITHGVDKANTKLQLEHRAHLIATGKLAPPPAKKSSSNSSITAASLAAAVATKKANAKKAKVKAVDPLVALAMLRRASAAAESKAEQSNAPAAAESNSDETKEGDESSRICNVEEDFKVESRQCGI